MIEQRQNKILEIIKDFEIETQDELLEKLKSYGFESTQATISRDIKKLHLIKIQSQKSNKYIYSMPAVDSQNFESKFKHIMKETIIGAQAAGNIVVVKTFSGMANAAAAAIDHLSKSSIIGSIAGDDTIFVVVGNESFAQTFAQELTTILKND